LELRLEFVRNALALFQPMSLLELGTDAGLCDRLSREGHAVYSSPVAQAGSAGFPVQVQRIVGVTRYYGYGEVTTLDSTLPSLAGRLTPWGWLGLKILDRDKINDWLPEEEILHRNGAWYRLQFRFDKRSGVLSVVSRNLEQPGGQSHLYSQLRLRAYSATEMEANLAHAGLRVEAVFGGWNAEGLDESGKALWLVARRAPTGPRR